MASFDLNVDKNVKTESKRAKVWGGILLALSMITLLLLIFDFVPVFSSFMLGVIGLFAYPFTLIWFCVGLALLSDKRFFLPIRYLVYLCCATVVALALINVIILGNPAGSVGDYIALSYAAKTTAGGALAGLILAPLLKTIGLSGTVIVLVLLFLVFVALIADFLHSIKKYGFKKVAKKNPSKTFKTIQVEKPKKLEKPAPVAEAALDEEVEASEEFNLFLDKKLEEQENRNALLKLGLIEGNLEGAKPPKEPKSLREHLLTPPSLEETYFAREIKASRKAEEIKENIEILKNQPKDWAEEDALSLKNFSPPPPEEIYEPPADFDHFDDVEEPALQAKTSKFGNFFNKTEPNNIPKTYDENKHFDKPLKPQTPPAAKYIFPPTSLLEAHKADLSALNEDVVGKRALLEETLKTFGIDARVRGVVIGPSVTRYEIAMPHGVSVKRILSLEDDIAMALASRSGIRIEAPIPGKSAVGIEVPNESIATVSLREIIETDLFRTNKSPVTFALGKNISGAAELCNLAKMPHILVAGATNSGKSICLNAIIISMIYKASPEDLRLILIDPKRVEFSLYNDLPHLLIPKVITEVDKAVNALLWCVNEMERRFELLQMARCRNSEEYNHSRDVQDGTAPKMPYIVVIVDELADLMASGKKELEEYIRRLTQKARAAGILLVLATQRPSVDVITGVIKANCPARISFALTSIVDSRTILDTAGAESLLGKGDMLYKPSDAPSARRVQGCFVSAEEVERVVEFVKNNTQGNFDEKTQDEIYKPAPSGPVGQVEGVIGDPKWDPLLPQALKMFIENGQASTSAIQRRFLAGFPRASRIVDQLCQMGYLSQPEGTKPRTVLITMEEFYEKFGNID